MQAKQVFHNAKWIIVCRIVQAILQLIIGMLTARYLGPSNYGLINYASSIVAFALPLMKLGFDSTLVRELIEDPEKEGEIVGTSLTLNVISALLCLLGVTAFVSIANAGERVTILVCILYSISLFCAALEMVQYWFQYKLLSKYSSIVSLLVYVVVAAYRIYLLITGKNVYWFALTNALDFGLIGAALLIIYFKKGGQKFAFSWSRAKAMLSKSKHYILASLMIVVIQNTDHVMITNMMGTKENGFYSAAITSAGVVQFVYTAIIDSFRPIILASKKNDEKSYEKEMSMLYCVVIYMALVQSLVFTLGAKWIMQFLYGEEYLAAVPILQILVWYVAFSFMGSIRNVWILAEEKQKYLWVINITGAIFNVALNAVMIPFWGACGAALASLLTQFFMNFVLGFIFKPIRRNNVLLLKGLNPSFAFVAVRKLRDIIFKRNGK